MKNKTLIIVGLVVVAVATTWYFTKPKTKEEMIKYLVDKGYNKDANFLNGLDDAFIKSWYDSAKSGLDKFIFNSSVYWVQGGSKLITR